MRSQDARFEQTGIRLRNKQYDERLTVQPRVGECGAIGTADGALRLGGFALPPGRVDNSTSRGHRGAFVLFKSAPDAPSHTQAARASGVSLPGHVL